MSSMLISMLISMLLLSSLHCDSYIKASVVPQAQRMSGHHRVNIKMFQCPDCGKEFTRKFNMECHRIVSDGDSNSEADSEESFDHGTEASDERDSSDEQESIADEGDKGDDDDMGQDVCGSWLQEVGQDRQATSTKEPGSGAMSKTSGRRFGTYKQRTILSQPSVARLDYSSMDQEDGISLCALWMWYQLQGTHRDSWTRNWIRTSFLW